MARRHGRAEKMIPPRGFWLALFASTIQLLLPFLVALDLVLASDPGYAGRAVFVCSSERPGSTAGQGHEHGQQHRRLGTACPLCAAIAAAQGFVAAERPSLAPPRSVTVAAAARVDGDRGGSTAAAAYDCRAPPAIL